MQEQKFLERMSILYQVDLAVSIFKILAQKSLFEGKGET